MRVHSPEKSRAIQLRKQGYSYSEIQHAIGCSKSSLSLWLREITLPPSVEKKLKEKTLFRRSNNSHARRNRTLSCMEGLLQGAILDVNDITLDKRMARLVAALLYYCEGVKDIRSGMRFTNSDPELLAYFLKVLRKGFVLDEKKFRVCLHLHGYHDEQKMTIFWSDVTGIPQSQFLKTYKKSNGGKNLREGYNGTASVRYHDVMLQRRLLAFAHAFFRKKGS